MSLAEAQPRGGARGWLVLLVAVIVAVAQAAWGIVGRVHAEGQLKTAAQAAAVPVVTVAKVQPMPPAETVVLPGSVRAEQETPIYARTSGYVKAWKVDLGARVKTGQLLALIDAPEVDQQLKQAQAELKAAEANAEVAAATSRRVAGLVATQSVSKQEGEDRAAAALATAQLVASNRANVDRLRQLSGYERVTAPFGGVITARETDVGHLINAGAGQGTELFRLADTSKLRVYVQAPEAYSARIKRGASADLVFSERPGQSFPAKVVRSADALDPQTRTLLVELDIDNRDGLLFPGSYTEAHFQMPSIGGGVRLPGNVLLFRADGVQVAVIDATGHAHLKPVMLGRDFGATIEIVRGVAPTDKVIVNPPASIVEGEKVRLAAPPKGAGGPAPAGRGKS